MQPDFYAGEVARCHREQAEIEALGPNSPAWLAALGWADWEAEKFLIEGERRRGAKLNVEA